MTLLTAISQSQKTLNDRVSSIQANVTVNRQNENYSASQDLAVQSASDLPTNKNLYDMNNREQTSSNIQVSPLHSLEELRPQSGIAWAADVHIENLETAAHSNLHTSSTFVISILQTFQHLVHYHAGLMKVPSLHSKGVNSQMMN